MQFIKLFKVEFLVCVIIFTKFEFVNDINQKLDNGKIFMWLKMNFINELNAAKIPITVKLVIL